MKKLLETYTGVLPGLLVIFYALGYVYLKTFYSQFGINIEFYITLTDILFCAIKFLLIFFLVYGSLNFVAFSLVSAIGTAYFKYKLPTLLRLRDHPASKKVKDRYIDIKVEMLSFAYIPPTFLILGILLMIVTGEMLFSMTYMMFSIFNFYYSKLPSKSKSEKNLEMGKLRDRDFISISLLVLLFVVHFYTGFRTAEHLKEGIYYISKPTTCKFKFQGQNVSTEMGSNLIFVGETTEYIFIYSTCDAITLTFAKGEITNLKFIPNELISSSSVRYYFSLSEILREIVKVR